MKNLLYMLITLLICQHSANSQNARLVDSLQILLQELKVQRTEMHNGSPSQYDTSMANVLFELSKEYWGFNAEKIAHFSEQLLALSEAIAYKKGIGNANLSIGVMLWNKSDFLRSNEYLRKAMSYFEEIVDRERIGDTYLYLGNNYSGLGDYPEGLKHYLLALKSYEEIMEKKGMAGVYNNIGTLYHERGNYTETLKNYFASLDIYKELQNKIEIAAPLSNIGEIYTIQGNYPQALNYFQLAYSINQNKNNNWEAINLYNIGLVYAAIGNYPLALEKHFASIKISEAIDDKNTSANSFVHIGNTYTKMKKYDDANVYLNKALWLAKEIGSMVIIKDSHESLANLNSAQGKFDKALEHYKLFISTRDSLENNEQTNKIAQLQMQSAFDKKELSSAVEQKQKDVLAQKEVQKQKFIRNGFVGGFAIVLLFAGVFFRQRNKTNREKKRSDDLLLNILPVDVAEEIKISGTAKAKSFTLVTVMFTDFKDFTMVSERISAELLVDEIHTCFSAFDGILQKHRIEKIKTIGDAYLCAGGLPVSNYTHAADMLHAAFEIRDYMLARKKEKQSRGEVPFELRIGIHTGPVVAGVVGVKKYAYDIWGDTVNIAARMEQNSDAGKINISGSTFELVKDQINCTHRGKIQAKNKGEIDMYFAENLS